MLKCIFYLLSAALLFTIAGCAGLDNKNNRDDLGLSRMHDPVQDVTYNGPSNQIKTNPPPEPASPNANNIK
ncbi:MAG: hypothetical protein ACO1OC_03460 [Tuberibacillus sp.]